jgi:DNA-binding MarR family transcriptional regulator
MNHELYEKLTRLQWLLHKQQLRGYAQAGPMVDTTRGQGRILAVLKLRDGVSTKDLSYLLGVRVSSLNELLAKLEKSGHVTREPSAQDKRVMLVKLTDKGREVEEPPELDFADIFDCLSPKEQQTFGEYLDRVIAALTEKSGITDEEEYERMIEVREHFAELIGGHISRGDFHRMFGGMRGFFHGEKDPRQGGFARQRDREVFGHPDQEYD